jgi:hypothetical protein
MYGVCTISLGNQISKDLHQESLLQQIRAFLRDIVRDFGSCKRADLVTEGGKISGYYEIP